MQIEINYYRRKLGQTTENHQKYRDALFCLIPKVLTFGNIRTVMTHTLPQTYHANKARMGDLLIIFYATQRDAPQNGEQYFSQPISMYGIETHYEHFMPPTGRGYAIKVGDLVIAEYLPDEHVLNILFDLFGEETFDPNVLKIFEKILADLNDNYLKHASVANSWVKTPDKQALIQKTKNEYSVVAERALQENKKDLAYYKEQNRELQLRLKQNFDRMLKLQEEINNTTTILQNTIEKFINDLQLISNMEKVEDLYYENYKLIIHTIPLYIVSDRGKRYYGGKYEITVDTNSGEVTFFNKDNPRHGYWTEEDPHPHVDGDSGTACFGNASEIVAELCSQKEFYALTTVLIDFLESTNTCDAAGSMIISWDEVDCTGNIIKYGIYGGFEDPTECEECGEIFEGEEGITAYQTLYEDEDGEMYVEDEIYICPYCVENYYSYNDVVGEYVHN